MHHGEENHKQRQHHRNMEQAEVWLLGHTVALSRYLAYTKFIQMPILSIIYASWWFQPIWKILVKLENFLRCAAIYSQRDQGTHLIAACQRNWAEHETQKPPASSNCKGCEPHFKAIPTVDGWNPAPPGMYETLYIMGYLSYQLVQDFFHQQYDW